MPRTLSCLGGGMGNGSCCILSPLTCRNLNLCLKGSQKARPGAVQVPVFLSSATWMIPSDPSVSSSSAACHYLCTFLAREAKGDILPQIYFVWYKHFCQECSDSLSLCSTSLLAEWHLFLSFYLLSWSSLNISLWFQLFDLSCLLPLLWLQVLKWLDITDWRSKMFSNFPQKWRLG